MSDAATREIGVGMLGYGFMAKAHSNAFRKIAYMTAPPLMPRLVGSEHTFVHEIHHLLRAIAEDSDVTPLGATFEDGYRAAEVCDAILRSAESGRREDVVYG